MASVFKRGGKANRGGYWYVAWVDHAGKRRTRCTKTTDKAAAERIAAKLQSDAALRREGVIDPTLDATSKESQRSIESHLADYELKMVAAHRTTKHVERMGGMIREFAKWSGVVRVADITSDKVNGYAAKLRADGLAAKTIHGHLTALKGFSGWLTGQSKLNRDPLTSIRKPNPKTDRRLQRRALDQDEWRLLIQTTEAGPTRFGMPPAARSMLYRLAIQTGLRSSEIRSVGRANLFTDSNPPYVTCNAGSAKNRKDARQYISRDLAEDLRACLKSRLPAAKPFDSMPVRYLVAEMLREDLAAARAAWLKSAESDEQRELREKSDFLLASNHSGQVLDFHALRHTCGAWLALAGVQPKVIQVIMRHSTITLTMDAYGHLFPGQETDAVAKLFSMLEKPDAQRCVQQLGGEARPSDASRCEGNGGSLRTKQGRNPLRVAALCEESTFHASQYESSRDGTRTRDIRVMNGVGSQVIAAKERDYRNSAALRTAVETDKAILKLLKAWPKLPAKMRAELVSRISKKSKPTRAR